MKKGEESGGLHAFWGSPLCWGGGVFFLQVSPLPGAGTKVCRRRVNPLPERQRNRDYIPTDRDGQKEGEGQGRERETPTETEETETHGEQR